MKAVRPSLFALLALPALALAQGSLTPAAAPAPTMKTLAQIEPRIPLGTPGQTTTTPLVISSSGSYILTGKITITAGDAITINASDVTLDLGGFTLSSSEAIPTGSGIVLAPSVRNITIRNGIIHGNVVFAVGSFTGTGFANGIYSVSTANTVVEDVAVRGVAQHGIFYVGIIRNCSASVCGDRSLQAESVTNSRADTCGDFGIRGVTLENCSATMTTGGTAILATHTATDCYGSTTGGTGVSALTATNCSGVSSTGTGIAATNVANCRGVSSSGTGISAITVSNSSGQSTSDTGLDATSATNCSGDSSSGIGLRTLTADGCHATTDTGAYGLFAIHTAQNSRGTIATGGATASYALYAKTALNCVGNIDTVVPTPATCYGLYAYAAANCYGTSPTGYGLRASFTATNCYGSSPSGAGLDASTADACFGASTSGYGLRANLASNSHGYTVSGTGLVGALAATNCSGQSTSGIGLSARNASNCYGQSTSGDYGLLAYGTANGCTGQRIGGVAIAGNIAIGCTSGGGTIESLNRYNMP